MKVYLKRVYYLLLVYASWLLLGNYAHATKPDTLAQRLEYQTWIYPQEKVYVATDKNIYVAGDTIRFRAFLVDAAKLTQIQDGSKYVYVEVINPFGECVKKIKVKENEGAFAGIAPLPEEMPEGTYTLAGYTLFMKNQGEDYFFRKPLPIKNQLSKKYRLNTSFDGDMLNTSLCEKFTNKPVKALGIYLISKDGVQFEAVRNRSNMNFTLGQKALKENVLKISYDRYEKFLNIPKDTPSFSVTFHPEGGYMIPGMENKVAFKALGNDGLSKDVYGFVTDSNGMKICDFASSHKGMGTFTLIPNEGELYKAIINGQSFQLPEPKNGASALSIDVDGKDSIAVKIKGAFKHGDILIADNCGIVTFAGKLTNPESKMTRSGLGSGLIQLYLVGQDNNIRSSRLIFNRNGYVYADSVAAVPRGDYAITSRKDVQNAVNTQSIVSEFMLQGDLKGHVEEPDYYFNSTDSIRDRDLDNLLLTQGWKRYDIQSALKGNFSEPKEPMEIGGELTGTVYSRWKGKPLQGAIVNVLAPEIDFAGVAETDSLGRYAINGIDWPDGTFFAVQAFNKNGNREHNHEVDLDVQISIKSLPGDYSADIYEPKMFDNGAIWLQELEVKASRSDEEVLQDMYKALGVRTVTADDIEKDNLTSYEEVIRKIPGLTILNGNLVNMGARGALHGGGLVELWVDGTKWEPSSDPVVLPGGSDPNLIGGMPTPDQSYGGGYFNTFQEFSGNYPLHIMESIQYFRSTLSLFISMTAADKGGALVMKTKDGSKITDWDHNLFIKRVTPIGYQKEAEAYEPHFTYDPTSDNPTPNSYWYPNAMDITDLPKIENTQTVVEGITDEGLPYFGVLKPIKSDVIQK